MPRWLKILCLLLADICLIAAASYIALVFRFETVWGPHFDATLRHLPVILPIYLAVLIAGRLYDVLWRYAGVVEMLRLAFLCAVAGLIVVALDMLLNWGISRMALALAAMLSALFIGAFRLFVRLVTGRYYARRAFRKQGAAPPRLMIVGAGLSGSYVLGQCRNGQLFGSPVLFVDDNPEKQRRRIQGVPVEGSLADIPRLAQKRNIAEIIIAIPSLKGENLTKLVDLCRETACRVRIASLIQSAENEQQPVFRIRELNTSDFLSRDEIRLDMAGIAGYLSGRTVLVTGGGGSIGAELCRQIMRFSPGQLIIFDIYENNAYDLECELRRLYGNDCPLRVLVGSVRDRARLDELFDALRPEVVFHAAAHKHVPLMELSPAEAVKNNVFGTLNVLETAGAHHAERFVMLSTDKAVNPTNVMGATKRICEMLVQYFAGTTEMRCMAVRFGNVLGSHGSVIPLFEKQIKSGGPVTVTHPDIIRYFMTIPEAAQLVLQAGALSESGAVYVLDMGKPVRILDLAKQMIRFYDYEPDVTMPIEFTGLRPGEKLYEELLTDTERAAMHRSAHDRIMVAQTVPLDRETFQAQLAALRAAAAHNDGRVAEVIARIVPGFQHMAGATL
ncbi:MAG: nucleoside-diphosphate sugar epimerase/dehydratase [Clostridia bacterium]|nr:nucleoside-diphosphate sugar epimerase/dehydratase [Clostridia bacterium]